MGELAKRAIPVSRQAHALAAKYFYRKYSLKSLFHIESNKYPHWIQEAEWPMGEDGIPMKFISQKRRKGKHYETLLFTEFLFEDIKTGKQRIVEQFT
ncbi:MAG: hypothetical protein J6T24_09795 [Clostridia bacterium]|nr:hypothetical protein [Clostridia bacterium]